MASICSILQTWRDLDFNFNFSLTDASRSGLFQDCLGSAGTDSRHSQRHDIDELIQSPDAAGGLDLHVWAGVFSHELEVMRRSAAVAIKPVGLLDEAIARAGLDERHAQVGADLTKADDVVVLQKVVFENDLEDGALCGDEAVDGLDLVLDVGPVAAEGLADVDDHVDLGGARGGGLGGLCDFDGGGGGAVGEADDGADADGGAGEEGAGEGHGVGLDAGGGDGGGPGEGEAGAEVGVGEGGVEEGVVDELGDLGEGDGEGWGRVGQGHDGLIQGGGFEITGEMEREIRCYWDGVR